MDLRTCYNCTFIKCNEDPDEWRFGGSEVTPPDSFKIYCAKDHWSYYEESISSLRRCLSTAASCKDFNPVNLPLVTHKPISHFTPAPPKCKKCQSRLHRYYDKWSGQQLTCCPVCMPTALVTDSNGNEVQPTGVK